MSSLLLVVFAAYESSSNALTLVQQRSPVKKVLNEFFDFGFYLHDRLWKFLNCGK